MLALLSVFRGYVEWREGIANIKTDRKLAIMITVVRFYYVLI